MSRKSWEDLSYKEQEAWKKYPYKSGSEPTRFEVSPVAGDIAEYTNKTKAKNHATSLPDDVIDIGDPNKSGGQARFVGTKYSDEITDLSKQNAKKKFDEWRQERMQGSSRWKKALSDLEAKTRKEQPRQYIAPLPGEQEQKRAETDNYRRKMDEWEKAYKRTKACCLFLRFRENIIFGCRTCFSPLILFGSGRTCGLFI